MYSTVGKLKSSLEGVSAENGLRVMYNGNQVLITSVQANEVTFDGGARTVIVISDAEVGE